jgi:hypothetical protein
MNQGAVLMNTGISPHPHIVLYLLLKVIGAYLRTTVLVEIEEFRKRMRRPDAAL